MKNKITYAGAGVSYDALDPFKRYAQGVARQTAGNISDTDVEEVGASRGESVYLLEFPDRYIAFVDEGLGTKHRVTEACEAALGAHHWQNIGFDTIGMAVNDAITLAARPLTVSMHLQVGSSAWFENVDRWKNIVIGWRRGCGQARCTWGPGETPALAGVIEQDTCSLSSACVGMIHPKTRLPECAVYDGDRIIIVPSTGIHANGLSLARRIAGNLALRYQTELPDGRTFGEAIMSPTRIYIQFVEACIHAGVRIRYMVNITGHGWRKLMRLDGNFAYEIDALPSVQPEFALIQRESGLSDKEMYETFNMGAGFALFIHPDDVQKVMDVDRAFSYGALVAGRINAHDRKLVRLRRTHEGSIEYAGDTLAIR